MMMLKAGINIISSFSSGLANTRKVGKVEDLILMKVGQENKNKILEEDIGIKINMFLRHDV